MKVLMGFIKRFFRLEKSNFEHAAVSSKAIEDSIVAALLKQSQAASSIFSNPTNSRDYLCSVNSCQRNACAKGLCNAHYIRQRKGVPLDCAPVRARKRMDTCVVCEQKTGAKGGWGMCPKHYKNKRNQIIKDAIVKVMGGKCAKCQKTYHRSVYDFHHLHGKDESPAYILNNKSPEKISQELAKCVLLCANCHREVHNDV